ncbi:hypothetical protein ACFL1G_01660 [Planctomycetota bacterium]
MGLKDLFLKIGRLLHISRPQKQKEPETTAEQGSSEQPILSEIARKNTEEESLAKLEKLEEGFNNMLGHLEGINGHLKNLPEFVENQKELTGQLINYIKTSSDKDDRLIEAVNRLPKETAEANRRIMWTFVAIVGICILVILVVAGILIYIK